MQLNREALTRAYRQMKLIREFEERLHEEIQTGERQLRTVENQSQKPWASLTPTLPCWVLIL